MKDGPEARAVMIVVRPRVHAAARIHGPLLTAGWLRGVWCVRARDSPSLDRMGRRRCIWGAFVFATSRRRREAAHVWPSTKSPPAK